MQNNNSNEIALSSQIGIFAPTETISVRTNKRTGDMKARVTTRNGQTFMRILSTSGLEEERKITLSPIKSKEQRDDMVRKLKKKDYTQDDIADMLGISQSTVSNILRSQRE